MGFLIAILFASLAFSCRGEGDTPLNDFDANKWSILFSFLSVCLSAFFAIKIHTENETFEIINMISFPCSFFVTYSLSMHILKKEKKEK